MGKGYHSWGHLEIPLTRWPVFYERWLPSLPPTFQNLDRGIESNTVYNGKADGGQHMVLIQQCQAVYVCVDISPCELHVSKSKI